MGIGNVDSLLNGRLPPLEWAKDAFTGEVAGGLHSGLYLPGTPGAGSAPSAGINGAQVLNGRSGTLAAPGPVSGKSCYLNMADFYAASGVDWAQLHDRMWENSATNVTITTLQAISPVALPARDFNGAAAGTGVGIALEVVTATANGGAVVATLTYTNSVGTTGRTSTVSIPATAVAGTWLWFPLAAGDYGIQGPTGFQLAATLTSGAISLVMSRRIGRRLRAGTSPPDMFGPASGGHGVADGIAPHYVYHLTGTAAGATDSNVQFAQA